MSRTSVPDPRPKRARLSGWGRYPVEECRLFRPESRRDLVHALEDPGASTFVSRGLGRSYGDAALNEGGGVISHRRLNRMLAFDPSTGALECEAGVSIGEIVDTFLPRGFFPPVVPGTRHVTVGGAIAADIHGKNQHVDGSFGDWTEEIELTTPASDRIVCSPAERRDLFDATVGGMGLTGPIVQARVRLRRVPSAGMSTRASRAPDLGGVLAELEGADAADRYTVAWLDGLASGGSLGRGIVLRGDHAPEGAGGKAVSGGASIPVPFAPPVRAVRSTAVRAFNAAWYRLRGRPGERIVGVDPFFFPLDAVRDWNRLYGPRGFLQYQLVLPADAGEAGLAAVLERLRDAGVPVFLAVLKRFGREGRGAISFPAPGWTLALDVPRARGVVEALRREADVVAERGGRIYLAKDAVLDAAAFERMYPGADRLRSARAAVGAEGRIASSLSRRIGLDRG